MSQLYRYTHRVARSRKCSQISTLTIRNEPHSLAGYIGDFK